ncbi:two-component sensor histidine kinase [Methylovulum psychrotolerans]|uniref:histidine kinase n=2 Tax=Methylovulum psychrotolerans TaxID=1704499 RepID=A0A2S5CSV5_9GAMM|nr:two-component sensor histidine kinase [Methylovulum psychrotolerans]
MKMIPRSVFSRSSLLIMGIIIITQLLTASFFAYWVQRPRLLLMADLAEGHLYSVKAALTLLPPEKRHLYVDKLANKLSIHVQQTPPNISQNPSPPPFIVEKFLQAFAKKLNPDETLIYQSDPEVTVWVRIDIDKQPYWLRFTTAPFNADMNERWLGLAVFMVCLALLGGLISQQALKRPLQHLSDIVGRIGKGQRVGTIKEEGPQEIIAFIHALNRMSTDLSAMEADRNLMLAGISHDLRTPITRIQLAIEMIGGDFDSALKNRVLANLTEIESGLKQCLDFAYDSANEPMQYVDLNDLALLCAANYKANGYPIGLALCEEAEVWVRPFAIERLLKNLLDNAIKYANKDITIATDHQDGVLYLRVLDRGAGISTADIDKLRRPFARADTARGSVGYGLGLAIVDKIIETHQAAIDFLQRDGGGLEVRIGFCAPLSDQPYPQKTI